jgi:hypothetical protein
VLAAKIVGGRRFFETTAGGAQWTTFLVISG